MTILGNIDGNIIRSNRRKSSIIIGSENEDDSDEDYDTAIGLKPRKNESSICLADSDDGKYLSPLKDANEKKRRTNACTRNPLQACSNNKKTPNPKPRKRRRSSARFLHLSGRFAQDNEDGISKEEQQENLGEMYRQAIRLNAANKINAGNSWGLNLIDNIDKFLGDDEDDDSNAMLKNGNNKSEQASDGDRNDAEKEKRVNFTKASCTLDASVKIYSYRVDDVHLTSYKVLANLNRSDGGNKGENGAFNSECSFNDENLKERQASLGGIKSNGTQHFVNTIESNPANLNINKLGAAYDIDPLFHKMSQKFDEGGAKGLLLVNLGVANDGCRIVLDSKEDSIAGITDMFAPTTQDIGGEKRENVDDEKMENADIESTTREDGLIDITNLRLKLQEILLYSPIDSIQLVPQLADLRSKYAELEAEGFIGTDKVDGSKSKRYANDEADEKAAEEVIHREAIERSRVSMGILERSRVSTTASTEIPNDLSHNASSLSCITTEGDTGNDFAPEDYGGGDDYDETENQPFNDFATMDETAVYSSSSFPNTNLSQDEFPSSFVKEGGSATNFLDSICSGEALTQRSEYDYLNSAALEKMTSGNQWAGSAHWKKSERFFKKVAGITRETPKERKRKSTKGRTKRTDISFKPTCYECLHSLLKRSKAKSAGKGTKKDQFRLSATVKRKFGKDRNTLPPDARISVQQLSTLFMRPNTVLGHHRNMCNMPRKSVGFAGLDTFSGSSFNDGVEDSDNDCDGFQISDDPNEGNFVENDDYVVQDLDDVRKVNKIEVAHATVAKKVDVRRLKKDLWAEVEAKIAPTSEGKRSCEHFESKEDDEKRTYEDVDSVLSFYDTVEKLTSFQKQGDVSLPFYFICMLHLANEKQLRLENSVNGLNDFIIYQDDDVEWDNCA